MNKKEKENRFKWENGDIEIKFKTDEQRKAYENYIKIKNSENANGERNK